MIKNVSSLWNNPNAETKRERNTSSTFSLLRGLIAWDFKKYTFAHAFDKERLAKEKIQYSDLTRWQQVRLGAEEGLYQYPWRVAVTMLITALFMCIFQEGKKVKVEPPTLKEAVALGAIEEVIFRGALQYPVQSFGCSSTFAIAASTIPFMLLHQGNAGVFLSSRDAKVQMANIMMFPTMAILCWTTGGLLAPIAYHVVHNALAITRYKATKAICQSLKR